MCIRDSSHSFAIEHRNAISSQDSATLLESLLLNAEGITDTLRDILTDLKGQTDVTAAVNAAIIRLQQRWDKGLWVAVLEALQFLGAKHKFYDVSNIHLVCLRISIRAGYPGVEFDWAPLLQLLSLPNMPTAVKNASSEVATLIRSAIDAMPPLPTLLELLHLADTYNVSLEASAFEAAVECSIEKGQPEQVKTAMVLFFSKRNKSAMLSIGILQRLVRQQGISPSSILCLCGAQRSDRLAMDLIIAGIRMNSPSWCIATINEAVGLDMTFPAHLVSSLAEAFLEPTAFHPYHPGAPTALASLQDNDGVIATLTAFRLMLDLSLIHI